MKMNSLITEISKDLVHDEPKANPNYRYEILSLNYLDQVVDLFTETFCTSEPMTQHLHMAQEKYKKFARDVTVKAIEDGFSVIALDGEKVIACALVEDILDADAITADFDPKFNYILALLGKLGEKFFADKIIERKHIAHLFITAVSKDYRRQGLSTQINFRAMQLARDAGYDFIYCEFTNQYCEIGTIGHLTMPRQLIGSCDYPSFTLNGEKPFANLLGKAQSYLWPLHADADLKYTLRDEAKTG